MSLFSFLKKETETIMVFSDHGLQVLQFKRLKDKYKILGFNELALTDGLVENGEIVNMDAFKDILVDLFSQATPNAIQTNNLHVNIPCELLYTFVQDSSHKSDESVLRASILETVRGHFPINVEDLVLEFDSAVKDYQISGAVYGSPKKWQERFMKVCKTVGISSVDFVPEPICQMAVYEDARQEDVALFSSHQGEIFLSIFHNGLLYDSYSLSQANENDMVDSSSFGLEFKSAQRDFWSRFNVSIKTILFVGFEKGRQKDIEKSFKKSDVSLFFVTPKNSMLGEAIPYEPDKSILFGLFNMIVSDKNSNLH